MKFKSIAIYLLATIIAAIGVPTSMPAESRLTSMKASDAVSQGILSNGIRYYIVTNPAWKGVADVALVQKAGKDDETPATAGMSSVLARKSLSELPHFISCTPFQFLSRTSIWPDDEGYVKVNQDATIYRFRNISLERSGTALDSTLLMAFDIVAADGGEMDNHYSPDSQAIIVSGDVDKAKTEQKMEMLSMMVTKEGGKPHKTRYEWKSSPDATVLVKQDAGKPGVTVSYRFRRIPEKDMGTVLPLMTTRYTDELRTLLEWRIRRAMESSGIPLRSVGCKHISGAAQPGDESFSVSVGCGLDDIPKVIGLLAGVLSDIDKDGLTAGQHRDVTGATNLWQRENRILSEETNSRWIEKCMGNFLYGSSLSADADDYEFFTNKNIQSDATASLFNSFAQALLSDGKDMTLSIDGDTTRISMKAALDLFRKGWDAGSGIEWNECPDDLVFTHHPSRKTKIRSTTEEPLFGGTTLTLANGIRVIYKHMPSNGDFFYSWLVKGGYSRVVGLSEGSGQRMADMLALSKIDGIPGEEFISMLRTKGISLSANVAYSDFTLSGSAPASQLPLLLQSVEALAYRRSMDGRAFDYYLRCDKLHDGGQSLLARLDGLTGWRTGGDIHQEEELPDDFLSKSHGFFDDEFARMNDGVLILVGDLNEDELRKALTEYMGAFHTIATPTGRMRVGVERELPSVSSSVAGDASGAAIAMSSALNFTTETYVAAAIASMWLADNVSKAVAQHGWKSDASWHLTMFPDESLRLEMELRPAKTSGLPASMLVEHSPHKIMEAAKDGLSAAISKGISPAELAAAKNHVISHFESQDDEPASMCKMLSLRYAYGKDLVTDFRSRAASVDSHRVEELARDLVKGGDATYLVAGPVAPVEEPWLPDFPKLSVQEPQIPDDALAYPLDGRTVPFDDVDLAEIRPAPFTPGKFTLSRTLPADTLSVDIPDIDIDALSSELGLQ